MLEGNDCIHKEDAGAVCGGTFNLCQRVYYYIPFISLLDSVCSDGDVQLVGGDTKFEGLVQLCLNSSWGTVCDDEWDELDRRVACRQLGYGRGKNHCYTVSSVLKFQL